MRVGRAAVAPALAALLLASADAAAAEGWTDAVLRPAADAWAWLAAAIAGLQADLHRQLAEALRALKAQGEAAAWGLIGLSFLYGVFHAAGPGHGNMVISTYMLTHESRLRRGLAISALAALAQGLTAIVLVEVTVALLGLTLRQANEAAIHVEHVSYALVALVGLMLLVGGGRRLLARRGDGHGQAHTDGSEHGADCGHAHGPTARELQAPLAYRQTAAIVLSIGVRPCSGAVLVLLFAHVLELHWAGIAAVAAMSAGTALTVSCLAALSVFARALALKLTAALPEARGRMGLVVDGLACLGGIAVLALGLGLFYDALAARPHPLF